MRCHFSDSLEMNTCTISMSALKFAPTRTLIQKISRRERERARRPDRYPTAANAAMLYSLRNTVCQGKYVGEVIS